MFVSHKSPGVPSHAMEILSRLNMSIVFNAMESICKGSGVADSIKDVIKINVQKEPVKSRIRILE